ncbi:MBL fold metallo-hydrolase [Pedobacter frigiditerrae]|uniref:MBL fold metallo-hydrolase n=1 Tax=Pedobacter frigiditerrae TaxID=2530452 RepID=A0A4R0MPX9_9SPHI|nr:MBL fold metallo-hydrolase [Pedobacter frigiditerrae]TCC88597.1 MBL fold metallo-hydrolase [Pedobacter frigiditerrae]
MSKMYIGYPQASLAKEPGSETITKQALWGDWCEVLEENLPYVKIRCRGAEGWVKKTAIQSEQILEINFVDVGQGDGCFIVTPDDKFILIDAGEGDNMYHFLNWRFNLRYNTKTIPIEHLIISHSDTDHYKGFGRIVNSSRFEIQHIHHNGIIERKASSIFGPVQDNYLMDIRTNREQIYELLKISSNRGDKFFPNLLFDAMEKSASMKMSMLEKGSTILGYGPTDKVHFNILGPVTEQSQGKKVLRVLGSPGETKNGHSVIVQLKIGNAKILLGGDLNDASEEYLTEHYTGYSAHGLNEIEREDMIKKGRAVFESDVLKSCHHGSHKFMDDFLSFFNPIATIISSGDNETHTHPRPDTLGAIGKHSRGKRPLIFSTELARSAKEKLNITDKDYAQLYLLNESKKAASPDELIAINEKINNLRYKIERTIAVYGMITVRTDGKKILIAQKKEAKDAGFIYYELLLDTEGKFYFKQPK